MKFGLDIPTTGIYADVRVLATLADEFQTGLAYTRTYRRYDTPFEVIMGW